jgi:uncharacterized membrane protein
MADRSFALQCLTPKKTLSSNLQGYFHAAVGNLGPWLLTVIALGIVFFLTSHVAEASVIAEFRHVMMYNFCFAAIFCVPIMVLTSRYLANCIYSSDLRMVPGLLGGALTVLYCVLAPLAFVFYFGYTTLTWQQSALAVVNFLLISTTNLLLVFLPVVRNYGLVFLFFSIGFLLSFVGAFSLASTFYFSGLLTGLNLGFLFFIAVILARIFAEFPKNFIHPFRFLTYFHKYWDILLATVIYACGIWVDKWVMWLSPLAERSPAGFLVNPSYDSPMFLAYLTVLPGMALFLMKQEGYFYEVYLRFYRSILNHNSFKTLDKDRTRLGLALADIGRELLLLQALVCLVFVTVAPRIFETLGLNLNGIGIFRFGVLGAAFHVFHLVVCIFLFYLDNKRGLLAIAVVFFLTNSLLTLSTVNFGVQFYGYGYLLSSIITFLVSVVILEKSIRNLLYNTFVMNNAVKG